MTKLILVFLLFFAAFMSPAEEIKIKRPIGVLPIQKDLNRFYSLEIMKLTIGIVMKSEKHTLFLNSQETSTTDNIIDFIEFNFKKKKGLFDLKLNLLTNGEVKRDVDLKGINQRNILFYTRLAVYEILFGKAYLKKNYQKILDEHKRSHAEVKKRHQNTLRMDISKSTFFKKVGRASVNKSLKKSKEGKVNSKSNSISQATSKEEKREKIRSKRKKNKKKLSARKKELRRKKIARKIKAKSEVKGKVANRKNSNIERGRIFSSSKAELSRNLNKGLKNSGDTSKNVIGSSGILNDVERENRVYRSFFKRKGKMSVGIDIDKSSKTTKDLISLNYEVNYLNASFSFELPNSYTLKDSFWFSFNYLHPIDDVRVTVEESESSVELEQMYQFFSFYQMYLESSPLSLLIGLNFDRSQFVNLAKANEGFSLGVASGMFIYGGLQYDAHLLSRKLSVKFDVQKMFFGSLDYNVDSEVTIDALEYGIHSDFQVFNEYYFAFKYVYSQYSSRTRASLNDEESTVSVGLTYYL